MKHLLFYIYLLLCIYCKAQTSQSLETAKILARSANKLILVDFTATWCGPCKMMDKEFWNKEEYQNSIKKFVVVKIDIDEYKSTAMDYNVEAIPNIKIVDASGEQLCEFVGYEPADQMEKKLAAFPSSVGDLYDAIAFEKKGSPTAEECLYAASGYQTLAQSVNDMPKDVFLAQSNKYFKRCKKSNPTDSIAQKADIGRAFNYVLDNEPQKATEEINIDKIHDENKAFAMYILARAYRDMKDKGNTEKYLSMLEGLNDDNWKTFIVSIRNSLE